MVLSSFSYGESTVVTMRLKRAFFWSLLPFYSDILLKMMGYNVCSIQYEEIFNQYTCRIVADGVVTFLCDWWNIADLFCALVGVVYSLLFHIGVNIYGSTGRKVTIAFMLVRIIFQVRNIPMLKRCVKCAYFYSIG